MTLKIQTDSHIVINFLKFSAFTSFLVSLIGIVFLIDWGTGNRVLMSISDTWNPMQPDTALCFIFLGLALLLLLSRRDGLSFYFSRILTFVVMFTALLTAGEYAFGLNTGIDTMIFGKLLHVEHVTKPERMAPNTALCFILLSSALLLAWGRTPKLKLMQSAAAISGFISLAALVGYLYGVPALRGLPVFSQMAAETAIAMLLLSLAVICAHPEGLSMRTAASDGPGGTVMRWLLPALIIVTIFSGWLVLMGERIGTYDSSYGLALFAVLMVVVMTVLITRSSIALQSSQVAARKRIEEMLALEQEQTEELRCQGEELAAANEELLSTNEELSVTNEQLLQANEALHLVNEVAADFLGHASLEHSLETLLNTAKKLVRAESVSIAIYEHPDIMKTWIFEGGGAECRMELQQQAVKSFPHLAEKYSKGVVINNDASGLQLPKGHITLSNLLAMGFEVTGGWAHLFMANKPGGFDDVDAERAEVLTHITKIIIDRAVLDESERDARSEAERRAGELQAFISSMADGVTLFDAEGNLVLINSVGREMFGIPPDEPLDDWKAKYSIFNFEGEPLPVEQTASCRALRGETITGMRYKMASCWGKTGALSVSASPVRDQQGRVIGATSVFRDITEQIKLEKHQEELYEREHHIARTLQKAVVPEAFYNIPGCRVVVKYEPALKEVEVGGDFYDVFEVGENKIGILIGDVAGKGLPAAIRVAAARYAIRSYAFLDPDPSVVLTLANDALSRDGIENGKMLTAFFGVIDLKNHTLTSASGGHEPPLILGSDGSVEEVDSSGVALGIAPGFKYSASTRPFGPADVMVLFTDGVTEARTSGTDLFGVERVVNYLSACARHPLDQLASGLMDKAKAHAGGAFRDDAAVLAFSFDTPCDTPVEDLVIQLNSDIELTECRVITEEIALRAGFSREDTWDIVSSVFEACVNALVHGDGNANGGAKLQLLRYTDRITAVIRDDGKGFAAPSDSPIPPATSPRGRGIPLMRLFMDEVEIDSSNGCTVTMTKWLPDRKSSDHDC